MQQIMQSNHIKFMRCRAPQGRSLSVVSSKSLRSTFVSRATLFEPLNRIKGIYSLLKSSKIFYANAWLRRCTTYQHGHC
jgi:hypothetical protein